MSYSVTVVGMIYKSIRYLDFMMRGIRRYALPVQEYNVDYLIIANDPLEVVSNKLKSDHVNHILYRDSKPDDYYLNRVYRAWNAGGRTASGDVIVFVNSDMAFSPRWLENLLANLNENTIPCSRLVESGKLRSGLHAISRNFGRSCKEFNEVEFLKYAEQISISEVKQKGLFMPCAFYKDDFIGSGGYPEGNIYVGGVGAFGSKFLQSGDVYFFHHNSFMKKKNHVTVFDSIVYHVQEGELDA